MKIEDIKRKISASCKKASGQIEQEIYMVIDSCLNEYYGEFKPEEYIRTGKLLHSMVHKSASSNSGFTIDVYFDSGLLDYENGVIPLKNGGYGWATWGAEEVLDTAMHGSHGGYVGGTAIWDESMSELGDIIALVVSKLKAAGLPVH